MQKQTWGRWVTALSAVGAGIMLAGACGDDKPGPVSTLTVGGNGGDGGSTSTGGSAGSTSTGGTAGSTTTGGGGTGGVGGGGGEGGGQIPDHCTNQTHDDVDGETDIDCGGPCPPCTDGLDCVTGSDCQSLSCVNLECATPTCVDEVHNGQETDEDCGGPNCGPCEDGLMCTDPSHCQSGVCTGGICQQPTCNDSVNNGDETDVDCGGSCPGLCSIGQGCDGNDDCVGDNCQSHICDCPSGMEIVPVLGGGAHCIDEHEVDYTQYEIFWVANPTPGAQIQACQWNPDYTPELNWPEPNKDLPVVGVNWCEAYAFCEWSGKRLCGQIGGGSSPYGAHADANTSQWFNGCSAQGNNDWPYGNTYNATGCNGADFGAAATINPACSGMPPGCALCYGGAPDLRQMSGNVSEWEDSCNANVGSTDSCRVRGGSYESASTALRCDADASAARDYTSASIGFRCCF